MNKIKLLQIGFVIALSISVKANAQTKEEPCKPSILGISGVDYEPRMKIQQAKKIDLPADCKMEIVSYDITYKTNDKIITKKKTGSTIDASFIDIVNRADKELYIEKIKAKDLTTGEIKTLKSIIIKFKN